MVKEKKFTIDFGKIRDQMCPEEPHLPIHGVLDVYRAIGLFDFWVEFLQEAKMESADPKDYLFCNLITMTTLQSTIQNNWETFNIDIIGDDQVIWKPNDLKTRRKRGKKLKAKVRNSVHLDFNRYCPALDDNIEDVDVIIFRLPEEKPEDTKVIDK